jgi:hypothetical protein
MAAGRLAHRLAEHGDEAAGAFVAEVDRDGLHALAAVRRCSARVTLVKAMIVVEPSLAKRLAAQAFATIFAKFWGYPLLWADTRDAAVEMAAALLAKAALPDAAE